MSVAELEEKDIIEDESIMVEEVDEEVDNDQTEVIESVSEESSDEEISEVEEEDGIEISFDGESLTPKEDNESPAPGWVKDLRKNHKDAQKENRELKKRLEEIEQSSIAKSQGEKPKAKPSLEDFDYDSDLYENALGEWIVSEKERESQEVQIRQEQERQSQEWQNKLNDYENSKKSLKVKDYDDAWVSVENMFNQTQQGIIVQGSDNPALSFYAIGKNTKLAEELSNIKDPVKFAFAVSKMESKLKYGKKKARTSPEGSVKSSGTASKGADQTLDRLEKEADKTGDRSKIYRYKQSLREKQRG
jgi:hypothetical protein